MPGTNFEILYMAGTFGLSVAYLRIFFHFSFVYLFLFELRITSEWLTSQVGCPY
jgi:hypothetical protein